MENLPNGLAAKAMPAMPAPPAFNHPPTSPVLHQHNHPHQHEEERERPSRTAQSLPDTGRRHSLPLHFLSPGLRNANSSTAGLVESGEAARGEHIVDEATAAHRISALRQLNGGVSRNRHQYAKSTGARNSTYNQPIIVRTYSGAPRARPQQQTVVTMKKSHRMSAMVSGNVELKLPPVEAFSFKGIMDEIKHGVAEDLERIAEICARSKYSLSNQYEAHMPPHGRSDEPVLQTIIVPNIGPRSNVGPTLQAIASDDEQPRNAGRRTRKRTKSVAYSTLETIMSSSRSSDEDKTKKKPAAVLAEEVRGRAERKESGVEVEGPAVEPASISQRTSKHTRSRSATFASMVIDNAQSKPEGTSNLPASTSLISEPARPQTSTAADMNTVPEFDPFGAVSSTTLHSFMSTRPSMIRNESRASTLLPELRRRPSILGSFGSWLPWTRPTSSSGVSDLPAPGRIRSVSHAEGSLRELLKSTELDNKGKGIVRIS